MLLSFDYSRVIAALEDRIRFLIEKFPSVPEASIRFLSTCDPSGGKYLEYLVSQRAKGILDSSDDEGACWAVKHALEFFMMVNQSKRIKEHIQEIFSELSIPNEIFQINIENLYELAVKYYGDVKDVVRRSKIERNHGKVIYQDDTYKIIAFKLGLSVLNPDDLISEICAYGKGKWCTQHRKQAEDYLNMGGGIYIVFKDGKSLLQTDGVEFKNVINNNFSFSEYYSDLAIILMKTGVIELHKKTQDNPNPNKRVLDHLSYYLDFMSAPVRQYLIENGFA